MLPLRHGQNVKCDGKIVVQAFVYDANEKSAKIIQLTGGLSRKKKRIFMRAAKAQLMQSREGPYRENCSIFSYHQQWAKVYFSILTFLLLQHWWQAEQSSSYLLLLIKAELEFSTFKCILHSDLSFCYFWKPINFQNHFCAQEGGSETFTYYFGPLWLWPLCGGYAFGLHQGCLII